MVGTGGIGSGKFFALDGNHALGREESRSGRFLDRHDYCKLHIISHYVKSLLGRDFVVYPVGRVGGDDIGARLLEEMQEAGITMDYVERVPGEQTMFSFCFVYPDGSGGNMTTDDSACSHVEASDVARAEKVFAQYKGDGIALAVPEVPMPARRKLLELAVANDFFCVASFISGEMEEAVSSRMLEMVDLLALNKDEASALAGVSAEGKEGKELAEKAIAAISKKYPKMMVSVTAGPAGSWVWNGERISYCSVVPVEVSSTAGAGDAYVSGIIAGLAAGLSLTQAQQLGTIVAAASVMSPHTINKNITRTLLRDLASRAENVSPDVLRLLEDSDCNS